MGETNCITVTGGKFTIDLNGKNLTGNTNDSVLAVGTTVTTRDGVNNNAGGSITNGIGGGLFGPDNDCTRAQIVTFLYRTYDK